VASTESIRELAEPVLASAGLELWDVEIRRDVVRVMVDRPGGIDLDGLSAASSLLSPLLDAHPEAAPDNRYELEVSSPGVERTLRTPEQFRRYLGSEITVKTSEPISGARRHRGRLVAASDAAIAVLPQPNEADDKLLELRYDQIDRARTVLVWGDSPERAPGGRRRPGRSARPTSRAGAAHNSKDAAP
jgi:ribosome maturation factor RimP